VSKVSPQRGGKAERAPEKRGAARPEVKGPVPAKDAKSASWLEQAPQAHARGAGKRADAFRTPESAPAAASATLKQTDAPAAPAPGAFSALKEAKEAGVYFRDQSREEGHREEDEDPELAAAVEEAIRLLFGVRGIHHVGPGLDEAGQPVVLIVADAGFGEASLRAVPAKVRRFDTLLALPYDLLPLRRDGS
jgi:hypothetical protein